MIAFPSPHDRRRTSFIAAAVGLTAASALAYAGCSNPAPLVARGAWAVSFIDTPNCGPGGHNSHIGEIDSDSRTKLVDNDELLNPEDEGSAVEVTCKVKDNGSGFYVEGYASVQELLLYFIVENLPSGATKDKPAKGTVQYKSHDTGNIFNSPNCIFYFLNSDQSVKAGDVFLTFECPDIAYAIDNVCIINPGYAAFEHCKSM
jgi:hypothetical protein